MLFFYPVILIFIKWLIFKEEFIFNNSFYLFLFFCFWIIFLFSLAIRKILINQKIKKNKINNAFTVFGMLIFFIPVSIPVSNEIQYGLSGIIHISPSTLSRLIIFMLLILSVLLFLKEISNKDNKVKYQKIIKFYFIPIIIFTLLFFKFYHDNI